MEKYPIVGKTVTHLEVGVWCAMSARKIARPMFYDTTNSVNSGTIFQRMIKVQLLHAVQCHGSHSKLLHGCPTKGIRRTRLL